MRTERTGTEPLADLIESLLREQPDRQAPEELQRRVLMQIAQRALLPWYRKGFAHWPLAARGAFLVASCGLAKLCLFGAMALTAMSSLGRLQNLEPMGVLNAAGRIASAPALIGASFVRVIPPPLLYGGALVGLVLYLSVFVLGAFSYRVLCRK